MFESLNPDSKKLTSLDLGNPPRRPAQAKEAEIKAEVKPVAAPLCVAKVQTLEAAYEHFAGTRRKLDEMVRTGLKPSVLFYVVFPQQGLTYSFTTNDGLRSIVPVFNSNIMAEAFISAKKVSAVVAACRIESLPSQAEQWVNSGINFYALNACCKCFSLVMHPISELQSEESFLATWRVDLANRRHFAQSFGQNASNAIAANPKQARAWFEALRDHIDPANPYLQWMIAILAGMAGDMEANAASIKQLEAFGPPFVGKLQGTSFDPTVPGSQVSTMAEAMVGLGASLGYLDPSKMPQNSKPPKD